MSELRAIDVNLFQFKFPPHIGEVDIYLGDQDIEIFYDISNILKIINENLDVPQPLQVFKDRWWTDSEVMENLWMKALYDFEITRDDFGYDIEEVSSSKFEAVFRLKKYPRSEVIRVPIEELDTDEKVWNNTVMFLRKEISVDGYVFGGDFDEDSVIYEFFAEKRIQELQAALETPEVVAAIKYTEGVDDE